MTTRCASTTGLPHDGSTGPRHTASPRGDISVKSSVEHLNPTRVKLTVEVPFSELDPQFDAAYKAMAGQVNIPGFR
jgi:hypothetical protein